MNGLPSQVASDPGDPDGTRCDSLEQALSRIAALTFCGVWHTDETDYAVFDDRGRTASSFFMQVGETVGECMQRLVQRYEGSAPD